MADTPSVALSLSNLCIQDFLSCVNLKSTNWSTNTGVAGGTFDSPIFWYELSGEVFMRSKGHFVVEINAPRKMDTFPNYDPKGAAEVRTDGSRNKK